MKKFAEFEKMLTTKSNMESQRLGGSEFMTYFLRADLGRRDLAIKSVDGLKPTCPLGKVEQIRNTLAINDYGLANTLIQACEKDLHLFSAEERLEFQLEKMRLKAFTGEINEAVAGLLKLSLNASLLSSSRLTTYQMLGYCYFLKKDDDKALDYMNKALVLSDLYPMSFSTFATHSYLALLYARQNNFNEAEKSIKSMQELIGLLTDDKDRYLSRLIYILRSQFHVNLYKNQKTDAYLYLRESRAVAAWLNDTATVGKCDADLIRAGLNEFQHNSHESVFEFSNWLYMPRLKLIFVKVPKAAHDLSSHEKMSDMLEVLIGGQIELQIFFEKIWGIKYNHERHYSHIKSMLSKLKKFLPPNSLSIKNASICLK